MADSKICQLTGKGCYASRAEAQKHSGSVKKRTKFDKPLTTYHCLFCNSYHLTKITNFKRKGKNKHL